ncbi:hypothetical protein PAMP_012731 [Pampus punctatissimus]
MQAGTSADINKYGGGSRGSEGHRYGVPLVSAGSPSDCHSLSRGAPTTNIASFSSFHSGSPTLQREEEKKKENEPASEKMNGQRLSKSNKFRGINVQTSPGISKGAPDSKLFKPAVQSGDTSIRISNSDRIDRPRATTQAENELGGI